MQSTTDHLWSHCSNKSSAFSNQPIRHKSDMFGTSNSLFTLRAQSVDRQKKNSQICTTSNQNQIEKIVSIIIVCGHQTNTFLWMETTNTPKSSQHIIHTQTHTPHKCSQFFCCCCLRLLIFSTFSLTVSQAVCLFKIAFHLAGDLVSIFFFFFAIAVIGFISLARIELVSFCIHYMSLSRLTLYHNKQYTAPLNSTRHHLLSTSSSSSSTTL